MKLKEHQSKLVRLSSKLNEQQQGLFLEALQEYCPKNNETIPACVKQIKSRYLLDILKEVLKEVLRKDQEPASCFAHVELF